MGGTLTLWPGADLGSQYVFGVVYNTGRLERIRMTHLAFCTLLGPEGPGLARESGNGPLDLVVTATALFRRVGRRTGYRPYFENYTVDASILERSLRAFFSNDDQGAALRSCDDNHWSISGDASRRRSIPKLM